MKRPVGTQGDFWLRDPRMLRGLKSIVLLGREGRYRTMRFRYSVPKGPIISAHGETVGPCFPQTFRVLTGRFMRVHAKPLRAPQQRVPNFGKAPALEIFDIRRGKMGHAMMAQGER